MTFTMNFSSIARVLPLVAFVAAGCAATPATRTVLNTDSTTSTAAGGQTRTTVTETSQRGTNGAVTSERTETVRTTTPAPAPTPPPPPQK
jgi:hypothetical protein